MRKRLIWTAVLGAAIAVVTAGIAVAYQPTVIKLGNLVLKANGGVTPTALPKKKLQPITVNISGDIETTDGSHPPALSEGVINFDKNGVVNPTGLPACKEGQLEARETKEAERVCRSSIVGKGHTKVVVEFPEQRPFTAEGPLVLFNGGGTAKSSTMFIHAYVAVPAPTALVTVVKIKKIHKGAFGTQTAFKVPVIAGGAGSVTHFDLKVHRIFKFKGHKESYVSAKCPKGHFSAEVEKAVFGSVVLSGEIVRPCTPRG